MPPARRSPSNRLESTSSLAPFGVRDFRLLFFSFVGWQLIHPLQVVTLIFWIQENADDDSRIILVGAVGTIRGLGALIFSLFSGAVADRFDRRRVVMTAQSLGVLLALTTAVVMSVVSGSVLGFGSIFVLAFLAAAPLAVDIPTRQAMVPDILGPRLTAQGLALNSAGMQLAMPFAVFGVGIIIEALGTGGSYALSAVGHASAVLLLLPMSYRSTGGAGATRVTMRRTLSDVLDGFRFARGQAVVLWVILLVVVVMALGFPPTASLGPTWITTVVGASLSEFGFIMLTWGLGAFAASILLTRYARIERYGLVLSLGALTFAGSFVLFAAGTSWPFATVGNFGVGFGFAMMQVSATTLLAHHTPNETRGRVMSLLMISIFSAQMLALPIAALGQAVSLQTLFPILSYVCVGSAVLMLLARRELWQLRVRHGASGRTGPDA
ncbi:MAG: MFS family permease [Chloroflexi bacterium]|nr:MAG: MFS family permease [Chloroflexota bacterium]